MRTICFHIQPKRVSGIDVGTISKLMLRLALARQIREFSIQRGPKDSWVNFLFSSPAAGRTWRILHSRALTHSTWGPRLRRSAIVTCEGSRGWHVQVEQQELVTGVLFLDADGELVGEAVYGLAWT